jgi:hypothetical protein
MCFSSRQGYMHLHANERLEKSKITHLYFYSKIFSTFEYNDKKKFNFSSFLYKSFCSRFSL